MADDNGRPTMFFLTQQVYHIAVHGSFLKQIGVLRETQWDLDAIGH